MKMKQEKMFQKSCMKFDQNNSEGRNKYTFVYKNADKVPTQNHNFQIITKQNTISIQFYCLCNCNEKNF